jgi:hypothetical protein
VKETLEKKVRQATSTDIQELYTACTKQILIAELKKLQIMWPQAAISPLRNSAAIKK